MSGSTVPLTTNCDGAWYSVAVAIGYCSGCSTAKFVTSTPATTLAWGGASAASLFFCPQPDRNRAATAAKPTKGHNLRKLLLCIFPPEWNLIPLRTHRDTPKLRIGCPILRLIPAIGL